jgi:hypothetical protein
MMMNVISYLQANEVPIGLTPKNGIMLCPGPNSSNEKVIPSYGVGRWMVMGCISPRIA